MCQPKYGYISERKYILREVIRLKDMPINFLGKTISTNMKSMSIFWEFENVKKSDFSLFFSTARNKGIIYKVTKSFA